MRRAAIERPRTLRAWRAHLVIVAGGYRESHKQPGRFRKRSAGDCGKARCHLCHGPKLIGEPTKADLVARDRFRSSLEDYWDETYISE